MMMLFGRLFALIRRARALVLRALGLPSRDDILAVVKRADALRRKGKEIEHQLVGVAAELAEIRTQLGTPARGMDGRLRHVERNLASVVRHQYVDQTALPFPHNVLSQRFHLWSQNEEDGITYALFALVSATSCRFMEIGAGVNGGNSGFLAEVCGWTGLMVDGSAERVDRLTARFGRFGVRTQAAWITTDNINQLVVEHGLTGDLDLFSLDIDGNDYWVWRTLDACSPRVVIVEFNPSFGPTRAVTVRYDPGFDRGRYAAICPQFHGASLEAFVRLGREKGYRLVLVEPTGTNAYFLRNDVGVEIPAGAAEVLHPFPTESPQRLFDTVAAQGLPLVDFDQSADEPSPPVAGR
jgi:hypothetical protein